MSTDLPSQAEPRPPEVRLGTVLEGGLAPAILAIVERGARRRPGPARELAAEVELRLGREYPPVRIVFQERVILVEDAPAPSADIRIEGTLGDLTSLMSAPLVRGLPNPADARGRAAISKVVGRRVRVRGRMSLLRRLLAVIQV